MGADYGTILAAFVKYVQSIIRPQLYLGADYVFSMILQKMTYNPPPVVGDYGGGLLCKYFLQYL